VPLLGVFFESEPSPAIADVEQADERQRNYYDNLRRYNQGNNAAPQDSGSSPAH
jgi:hypothetical protein